MKTITILTIIAGLAFAGCIAPEADPETSAAVAPPPADRVEGMTMTETKVDKDVDCGGGNNTIALPESCAQRDLLAVGQIGIDELPIDFANLNGPIKIVTSEGDAWSFHAVVKVKRAPNEDASASIDQAWAWSHEKDGKYAIRAGPKTNTPVGLLGLQPMVVAAAYELALPEWVLRDVSAESSNGPITVAGKVRDLTLATSNGPITIAATPGASGAWSLSSTNGPITVVVPVDSKHGYDVDATTSNGPIRIDLGDGEESIDNGHGTFRSENYDARPIQTKMTINTSNGPITVEG